MNKKSMNSKLIYIFIRGIIAQRYTKQKIHGHQSAGKRKVPTVSLVPTPHRILWYTSRVQNCNASKIATAEK